MQLVNLDIVKLDNILKSGAHNDVYIYMLFVRVQCVCNLDAAPVQHKSDGISLPIIRSAVCCFQFVYYIYSPIIHVSFLGVFQGIVLKTTVVNEC